jgi:hypothetical protein
MARTRAAKETPASTPKKEVEADKPAETAESTESEKSAESTKSVESIESAAESTESAAESAEPTQQIPSQISQPQSLDTNVDPTTPDLLGDISDTVQTENARNILQNGAAHTDTEHSSQNGDQNIQNGGDCASGDLIMCDSNGELEKGALDSLSNKSDDSQAANKQSSLQSSLIELENGTSKKSTLEIEFDEILDLGSEDNRSSSGQQPPQPPILAFEPSSQQPTDLMS